MPRDVAQDRQALAGWFAPPFTVAVLAWIGALDPATFPAVNSVAAGLGCAMYLYSARKSYREGIEGAAVAHLIAGCVLAAYSILNAALATEHLSEPAFARAGRPLFPLLITSGMAGPVMVRRWRRRRVDDIVAEYKRLGDHL